ncbi:hypothetical protein IE53DRAFT_311390 [Violaceomyces palustris]|uniref:Uncharacterized protein n=1 Tax=Violaceomyces palustris TaxID=1673888 RepID=A0ACD0P3W8_9BASI|nr:hypothetical protein IE53DRAFT_311390 [Violaceomyces palustris]
MTVSHRKNKQTPKQEDKSAAEPGVRYHCDSCGADITLTVRIRCAGGCTDFDLCASCFCCGAEVASHKAWHDYRVVEQHSYPIFCDDWGADEELLLIDGCQIYGLGNWADIADHIGNRSKEEVEAHYLSVYVEGKDGTPAGDQRAKEALEAYERQKRSETPSVESKGSRIAADLIGKGPPVVGPNPDFVPTLSPDEFQRRKRRRIEAMREAQASYVPPKSVKPLVSAPTNHSELAGFMPGRLEFEHEYEQEAEHLIKDMEFGKVYEYGGAGMPSEWEALGGQGATQGHQRMEASGRGGPTSKKATQGEKKEGGEAEQDEEGETQDTSNADATTASQADADKDKDNSADGDDRAPDWDEDPQDLRLKMTVLEMYNERLDRRARRKEFIFERNLVDYKRNLAAERRRPKEERELLARTKHFAQMQTALDYEDFLNGLCHEEALTRAAAQLQGYRRMGILTLEEAGQYEKEKAERARRASAIAEGGLAAFPASGAASTPSASRQRTDAIRGRYRETSTPVPSEEPPPVVAAAKEASGKKEKDPKEPKTPRKPPQPLNLASAPSLNLLTPAEVQICSTLRILPQPFLVIKSTLITAFLARGGKLSRRECRTLVKIDVNKLGKVWDFFTEMGYFDAARKAGWTGGVGSPPRNGEVKVNGKVGGVASPWAGAANGKVGALSNDARGLSLSSTSSSSSSSPAVPTIRATNATQAQQQQALLSHNGRGAPLIVTPGSDIPNATKTEKWRPTAAV